MMDLNNMGAGKKLIQRLVKDGNIKRMGWSREQQQELINKQKNSFSPKTRNK
jgi:hypothetical protein